MVLGHLEGSKRSGGGGANLSFPQGAWGVSYGPPEIMETIITNVCWGRGERSQWKQRVDASREMALAGGGEAFTYN